MVDQGVTPEIIVEADLTGNGVYETDISAYVQAVSVKHGRRAALDPFPPRRAIITLDNEDSRFSPQHSGGPYSPDWKKNTPIKIRARHAITGSLRNEITNPSFETNVTGWANVQATLTRETFLAVEGRWGCKALWTGNGTIYNANFLHGAPGSGNTWVFSTWVRAGTGNMLGKVVRIKLNAEGGTGGAQLAETLVTLGEMYQRVSVKITPSAGDHTGLRCQIERQNGDGGLVTNEWFGFDGAMLYKEVSATDPEPYFDGDMPGALWTGTAHASDSTRPANPTFTLFTGFLEGFRGGRRGGKPTIVVECSTQQERQLRRRLYAGPFQKKPADMIFRRVVDLVNEDLTGGPILLDGAQRLGLDTYVGVNSPLLLNPKFDSAKDPTLDDPADFQAIEGDNWGRLKLDAIGEGWEIDVDALATIAKVEPGYWLGVFLFTISGAQSADGLTVQIQAVSAGTPISGPSEIVLSDDTWVYSGAHVVFVAGAATIRLVSTAGSWSGGKILYWACPTLYKVPRTSQRHFEVGPLVGAKWTEEIEYADLIDQSAGDFLAELAASIGGWFRDKGDGALVGEDYTTRQAAGNDVKLTITDNPAGDGFFVDVDDYEETVDDHAGLVRVSSMGDISSLPSPGDTPATSPKTAWQLEPPVLGIDANTEEIIRADYTSEDSFGDAGGLILRRHALDSISSGLVDQDGKATPHLLNYGRSGHVRLKTAGSAGIVNGIRIRGRLYNRQMTEHSFVENGGGNGPTIELEMPFQGTKTQIMKDVAAWAQTKYGGGQEGPVHLTVTLRAGAGAHVGNEELLLHIIGQDVGTHARARLDFGLGKLGISDVRFVVESWAFKYDRTKRGGVPELTLGLEEV